VTRAWAVHDRVAIRDFVGTPWLLGDLIEISAAGNLVIDLGSQPTAIRYPDDVRVVLADEVPIDERHWVPAKVRDQLDRIEAAERLREMWRALPDDCNGDGLLDLAYRLAVFDAHGGPDPNPKWAAAARALLTQRGEVPDAEPRLVSP
jgi:hypothetical protein